MTIKIVTICGSVRPGNFTAKALKIAEDELRKSSGLEVTSIDLVPLALPLPGMPAKDPDAVANFQQTVADATGVLMASPEYHGGISSPMKLAIDNLGFPSKLSGKPVSILGVASGVIGAIKSTEQLRAICAHVGAVPLPLAVSIPKVQLAFDADGNCVDQHVEDLIRRSARSLIDYIQNAVCPKISLEAILREMEDA
ncbi:NADPH-dependent FMN reductase [Hahella sp. CCB-MM4]|uniref:NADPH-dependent FMN reductase n=1 Tax=Hahella sp. (strain CCB-MM4) TaxID=1926491 RepID=UPI000B9ADFC4|nr:NAD(P)H-dependent oxidoreductase [Hahella sp. CCB-MM4]OZG72754.1 NADPH-dependent FMN reductase [Hahella sp. CCB-MM4]